MIPGTRPPAPPLPEADEVIAGKYRIVRPIGFGGMGMVFEATHLRLRQRVAIKMLHPEKMGDEDLARFDREGRAAVQLRGVNVARVLDVDTLPNGTPFMVMEYLVGNDLSDEVDRHGQLPVEVAADIVLQAADAMIEAHALGIVHRDLKPSNLFLCDLGGPRRLVKVLDFGISKVDEGDGRVTKTEGALGTALYMSPEQARAPRSVDARTDVWSLGVILFELLSGRPPFEGTMTAVVSALAADPVPSPTLFRADLPPVLVEVVMKALAKDREKRFQSAAELAAALAPFAPAEPIATLAMTAPRAPVRSGVDLSEVVAVRSVDPDAATVSVNPPEPTPAPAPSTSPAPTTTPSSSAVPSSPAPIHSSVAAPNAPSFGTASLPKHLSRRSRWVVVTILVAVPVVAVSLRLAMRDEEHAPSTPSPGAPTSSAIAAPPASSPLPTALPPATASATSAGVDTRAPPLSSVAPQPLPRPPRPPAKPSATPSASAVPPPSAPATTTPPPPPKNPVHI